MLSWIQELFTAFGQKLMMVLPLSPFYNFKQQMALNGIGDGLAWLNWFVDIPGLLTLLLAWLTAYGVYLLYRIILRWIKAVS